MEDLEVGHVGGEEDVLEVAEVPLGVHGLGEGVCQVQRLQVVEVREQPFFVVKLRVSINQNSTT